LHHNPQPNNNSYNIYYYYGTVEKKLRKHFSVGHLSCNKCQFHHTYQACFLSIMQTSEEVVCAFFCLPIVNGPRRQVLSRVKSISRLMCVYCPCNKFSAQYNNQALVQKNNARKTRSLKMTSCEALVIWSCYCTTHYS
jgi:hypothetical protein